MSKTTPILKYLLANFVITASLFCITGCKNESEGMIILHITNETDQEMPLQVFTMKNYTQKLDSISLAISPKDSVVYNYTPKKVQGGSDWLLQTPTQSVRFGYYPISLEPGSNVHYVNIKNDTILISLVKQ